MEKTCLFQISSVCIFSQAGSQIGAGSLLKLAY